MTCTDRRRIVNFDHKSALVPGDHLVMDTSLYVLHNEATARDFHHETLDAALEALNYEVGYFDRWVLLELDRVGPCRRVAEGRGHIKRAQSCDEAHADGDADAPVDSETAYEWRRLVDRRRR